MNETEINGETSDGFHTFNDLYDHRMVLTAALFRALKSEKFAPDAWPWRSVAHHPDDGPIHDGYFIVGTKLDGKSDFSYHYPLDHWSLFSMCTILPHAPKWDGHTPTDTIEILRQWAGRS